MYVGITRAQRSLHLLLRTPQTGPRLHPQRTVALHRRDGQGRPALLRRQGSGRTRQGHRQRPPGGDEGHARRQNAVATGLHGVTTGYLSLDYRFVTGRVIRHKAAQLRKAG